MPFTLNCPACGAAAPSADAARCDYCGSALTTVACPSCFGAMFVGMQFCPHCGVKAARVIDESAPKLVCPGCREAMHAVQVGSTPMYECGSCAGVWLDAPTFMRMCQDREERGAVAALVVPSTSPGVVPTAGGRVRYVPCPVCKKLLNRENFGRQSGVIIDVCKSDGVWFQSGELRSVLTFIDSGGLERARIRHEAQKAEERHKLEKVFHQSAIQISFDNHTLISLSSDKAIDSHLSEALRALFS